MSQLRANSIVNANADGPVDFPLGATGVSADGLTGTPDIAVRNITGAAATFTGDVQVQGTVTYEDVTNVDAIGIVTARGGLNVGPITGIAATITASGEVQATDIIQTDHSASSNAASLFLARNQTNTTSNDYKFAVKGTGVYIGENVNRSTNSGSNVTLLTTGLVGIGTDNPSNLLHIDGGTHQVKLSDGDGSFEFRAGNAFRVDDNGTERLRIDDSGRLLVNKTSSTNDNIAGVGYANLVQILGDAVGEGLAVSNSADVSRVNVVRYIAESSVTNGMELGGVSFGAGNTTSVERARILGAAQFSTDPSKRGGQLYLQTAGETSATPTTRVTISNTGDTTFTGNILPSTNGSQDLGGATQRWANLYTSDLDLSNEEKGGNEVDGTWGAYTIQEGEEDLFLINRRTGKKYKFMLQEVS